MCLLEGKVITPEMPGHCSESCSLYLSVCVPVIESGMLSGCECCGDDYCNECPVYEDCQCQKGVNHYVITTTENETQK